jgi:intron-binding protein aquarius
VQAVLESIRDIMNEDIIIPPWLHDIFLGYGAPDAAQWFKLPQDQQLQCVDFKDSFLDAQHVTDSFPGYEVQFSCSAKAGGAPGGGKEGGKMMPPFRITFPALAEGMWDGSCCGLVQTVLHADVGLKICTLQWQPS